MHPKHSCVLLLLLCAGDDLPGLLHNWGSGLHTISKHATVSAHMQPCLKPQHTPAVQQSMPVVWCAACCHQQAANVLRMLCHVVPRQDPQLKQSLLEQAASQLRSSIQFSRADPAPHNALGDVLMDAAELLTSSGSSDGSSGGGCGSSSEAGGQAGGAGGRLPDAVAAQAAAAIKSAVDEGYMAALTISRTNADALVSADRSNLKQHVLCTASA
jgi:hypothetical protein